MKKTLINNTFNFTLTFLMLISSWLSAQLTLSESHLPIFIVNTQSQSINDSVKITADLRVYFNDKGVLNNINSSEAHYDGKVGIEYRGSSSLQFPKKSFNIETRNEVGNNRNFPLLGFPSENDWVLYAPYSDKSLMRNVLAYHLFAQMGHYSPRTAYCELILNGSYQGVYIFMEKIKRDKKRLDVTEQVSIEDFSGGYILQIDRNDNSGWYSSIIPGNIISDKTYYQIIYPNDASALQFSYIKNYVDDFENLFNGENTLSLVSEIDISTFIDVLIINEFAKNVDAYRLSSFLYKDNDSVDGRLKFGPVWDFNIAFGNVEYYLGDRTDGWQMLPPFVDTYMPPYWMAEIFKQPLIRNKLEQRWQELIPGFLSPDSINTFIDEQVTTLGDAIQRNFNKWNILGIKIWPNPAVRYTYRNEINYLKDWINNRSIWLNNQMSSTPQLLSWQKTVNLNSNNDAVTFSHSMFYNSQISVDSVRFISFSDELSIVNYKDSVELFSSSGKAKNFIGIAYRLDEIVDFSPTYSIGGSVTSVDDGSTIDEAPVRFSLMQNYPNPFNPTTIIEYTLPAVKQVFGDVGAGSIGQKVKLVVYDFLGREVATIVNENQQPGTYKVQWDASTTKRRISSGIYFYKLIAGNYVESKKMVLIK